MEDKAFHNLWERVLLSTLYSLGILGLIGFSLWLAWSSLNEKKGAISTPIPSFAATSEGSRIDRDAVKGNFRRLLFSGAKPCAVRERKNSDLSACSVFGIKLGDTFQQVKTTIDGSGFFTEPATLRENCRNKRKNCQQQLYINNGAFTLMLEFIPEDVNPDDPMTVSKITAILSPNDNPYATAQSLRPLFAKLFGRPDKSEGGEDNWGDPASSSIRVYEFNEKLWVILEKRGITQ